MELNECLECGEILDHNGNFCSSECAIENRYKNRTCDICGGEFWDGGTSCTCDDADYEDFGEDDDDNVFRASHEDPPFCFPDDEGDGLGICPNCGDVEVHGGGLCSGCRQQKTIDDYY